MKAIILAGGKGTRLRPITNELPKPMVPVLNMPLMEHIILLLRNHGIKDIGATLMYMPQKIKAYFGDGSKWGVRLTWFMDEKPLGTAGSVLRAAPFLDDTFIVISGDCITDMNLLDAIEFHKQKNTIATIVLTRSENPVNYGIVTTDNCCFITGFLEKPSRCEVFSDMVNTGIYIFEPDILQYIDPDRPFDFSRDLFPNLLEAGHSISGYTISNYWSDIGSLDNYLNTHKDILDQKMAVQTRDKGQNRQICIGKSTLIEPTARIIGPCVIGNNCYIGHGTVIDSYTVIGDNCIIEEQVSIKRSIVHNNSTIGHGSELRGCILGNKVRLMPYVSCFENAAIGDESFIQERCIIKPNIKIWPSKVVEALSIVDRNIISSAHHRSSIFQTGGVSGTINVDITPEFASRLGSAFGTLIGQGNGVVVSSHSCSASVLFRHAFISGLMSSGVQIYNLTQVPVPLCRQAVRMLNAAGGVHIRRSAENPEKVFIDFLDRTGANIDTILEKNLENIFYKEDFCRCRVDSLLDVMDVHDFCKHYVRCLNSRINTDCVQNNPPTLFIMSNCENMLAFIRSIFERLRIPIAGEMVSNRFEPGNRRNVEHFLQADITAWIDCSGENLILMDSCGRVIDENRLFLLFSYILYKSIPGISIIAPLNMTSSLERMADKYGGSVKRTKVSRHAILRELMERDVYAAPVNQYLLFYDAVAALAKTIEFLCMNHTSLDNLLRFIPSCYLEHTSFLCPFEAIGRVMRHLLSDDRYPRQLADGIKIQNKSSWVLVMPDPHKPFIHLYAEARTHKEAGSLLHEYSERISTLLPDMWSVNPPTSTSI